MTKFHSRAKYRDRWRNSLAVFFCFILAAMPGEAATLELGPAADTSLFEFTPNNNMGGQTHLASGRTGIATRARGLVRFDLAGRIPANAQITSVTVTFRVTGRPTSGGVPSQFGVHRLLRSWVEGDKTGNQGAAASPGETTWLAREHPAVTWSAPGGAAGTDYTQAASATAPVAGLGSVAFGSTAALIADVQGWLANPGTNFGWMLISEGETTLTTARRFGSLEDGDNAPVLTIVFSEPVSAVKIDQVGLTPDGIQFSFPAQAGVRYDVEFRSDAASGLWLLLRTFNPDPAPPARLTVVDPLSEPRRFYRVKSSN